MEFNLGHLYIKEIQLLRTRAIRLKPSPPDCYTEDAVYNISSSVIFMRLEIASYIALVIGN